MKSGKLQLGYLMICNPVPQVYLGGLMVTDHRGLPVEFRYTEPVQPTRLQQVLYGQVLSAYIKREMILETLLKNTEARFQCLLVEDEHLAGVSVKGFPIVRIAATQAAPVGSAGKAQVIAPGEFLLQVTAEGSPIRIRLEPPKADASKEAPKSPPSEEALESPMEGDKAIEAVTGLLLEAGQGMDLVEPLRRIEKALDIICQEAGVTAAVAAGR